MGVAVVLAGACQSSGNTKGTTAPTSAPTAALTASPSLTPATGPLLVYTKEVRQANAGSRRWPTLEVVTYDIGAKRQLASFEVGEVGEYPNNVIVVGNKLAANLEQRIVLYNLDGSDPRELRRAPAGGSIIGIGASRDGTKIALAEQTDPLCDPECRPYADITSVVFLDVVSGQELPVVPQSAPGFADFRGQAWVLTWRDDGEGVVVHGATYSEQPGGTATVLLDGSVRTHDLRGYVFLAPNGRYAAHGFDLPCMNVIGHGVSLRDLDAEVDLASVQDDGLVFGPAEWSPDSTQYLYSAYAARPSTSGGLCPESAEGPLQWHLLHVDGSPPSPVPDPQALRDRWYGDRRVEFRCDGRPVLYANCFDEQGIAQPVDIYIADTKVDSGLDVRIIGYIQGSNM